MSNTNPTATPGNASSAFGEGRVSGSASSFSRPAALIGGAVALVALTAIATTVAVRSVAPAPQAAATPIVGQALLPTTKPAGDVADDAAADSKAEPKAQAKPQPRSEPKTAAKPAPKPVAAAARTEAEPVHVAQAPAVCATCGVIESVTPFEKKGEGTGIGAVAGGVIGGVLGHQMGGGRGKDAMTAVGVVGGGIAGHEIEKRQRATTMYSVKVRMEDGTHRTVTQSTAPTVGQKVTVEGSTIKARA